MAKSVSAPGEEHVLTDLLQRGVRPIPSATAQLASRSKTFQARIFIDFMAPGTLPIYDSQAFAAAFYSNSGTARSSLNATEKMVVLVCIFSMTSKSCTTRSVEPTPFPSLLSSNLSRQTAETSGSLYLMTIWRLMNESIPANFRKNLHCGGYSISYTLLIMQLKICRPGHATRRFSLCPS